VTVQESLALLYQQIQIFFIYLARPIVQQQLLLLTSVLALAWAVPFVLRYRLRYHHASESKRQRRLRLLLERYYLLLAPILALALNTTAVTLLRQFGYPYGILWSSQRLLWAFLAYRAVLAFLYSRYGVRAQPYHQWVLLPLFLWLIVSRMINDFVSTRLLIDIPLFSVADNVVTIGNVATAIIVLYWFIVAAWIIEVSLRRTLSTNSKVDTGIVESVVTVSRYVVIIVGVLLALNYLGLDLSTIAIIGGGLSIGVGFGLQHIVASFISGLVLLFEQSLVPGDVIDINGDIGTVEKVNMRATTVRTIDNVDVVIPNEVFLSSEVTTYTKTDNVVRVLMQIGVSYDSNPHRVRDVVLTAAGQHALVLAEPEPQLLFRGYGDSSLDFELAVWINRPELARRVSSDLYYLIWDAFAEAGIEIPFPQRDLNLGKGWEKVATA
jgi:small-conductance mechanosensitive channel